MTKRGEPPPPAPRPRTSRAAVAPPSELARKVGNVARLAQAIVNAEEELTTVLHGYGLITYEDRVARATRAAERRDALIARAVDGLSAVSTDETGDESDEEATPEP